MSLTIEVCVDSVSSAVAAQFAGADRLELCAEVSVGGTTPSGGMIAAVLAAVSIPVHVLIRPRPGGFSYSVVELDVVKRDIAMVGDLGGAGVVVGVLTDQGDVDVAVTRELVRLAHDAEFTFHRAFDHARDIDAALRAVIEAGVTRVLTSGGASSALAGAGTLARLHHEAAGRVTIMAGGGVREASIAELVRRTGVRDVHVGGPTMLRTDGGTLQPSVPFRSPAILDEMAWREIDAAGLASLIRAARNA